MSTNKLKKTNRITNLQETPAFLKNLTSEESEKISGGGINIGEPSPIDGLGRPVKRQRVISLVLLFANPFAR